MTKGEYSVVILIVFKHLFQKYYKLLSKYQKTDGLIFFFKSSIHEVNQLCTQTINSRN